MDHFLREWREARGLTLEQLGEAVHAHKSTISKLETGERRLNTDWMRRLAPPLSIKPTDLLRKPGPNEPVQHPTDADLGRAVQLPPDGPPVLPVYAAVEGGVGDLLDLETVAERIPVPPVLRGVEGACGVFVTGDSMEDRYYAGEILYVHPRKPVRPGNFVVVELENREGMVKRFMGWSGDVLELEQLNPRRRMKLPRAKVAGVYRIVGSQEG